MKLLQDVLRSIPSHIPVILDAKHSDLNTGSLFAQMVFTEWQVDAITLSAYSEQDLVAPFLVYPGKAVFVLCRTSNASAAQLQEYPMAASPFYLHVVQESKNWGTADQLGLEIGTTTLDVLKSVRAIAPERLILVRSIWQEGVSLPQILAAGLNHNGEGLLIPVPQDWMSGEDLAEIVVFLDHEQDVKNRLRASGYQAHSVLTISEVIETLQQAGRISEAEIGRFKSETH